MQLRSEYRRATEFTRQKDRDQSTRRQTGLRDRGPGRVSEQRDLARTSAARGRDCCSRSPFVRGW